MRRHGRLLVAVAWQRVLADVSTLPRWRVQGGMGHVSVAPWWCSVSGDPPNGVPRMCRPSACYRGVGRFFVKQAGVAPGESLVSGVLGRYSPRWGRHWGVATPVA